MSLHNFKIIFFTIWQSNSKWRIFLSEIETVIRRKICSDSLSTDMRNAVITSQQSARWPLKSFITPTCNLMWTYWNLVCTLLLYMTGNYSLTLALVKSPIPGVTIAAQSLELQHQRYCRGHMKLFPSLFLHKEHLQIMRKD